jgi:hypothetical protein
MMGIGCMEGIIYKLNVISSLFGMELISATKHSKVQKSAFQLRESLFRGVEMPRHTWNEIELEEMPWILPKHSLILENIFSRNEDFQCMMLLWWLQSTICADDEMAGDVAVERRDSPTWEELAL